VLRVKWRGLEEAAESQPVATLKEELESRKALTEKYVPAETLAIHRRTVEGLHSSGMADRILPVGDQIPTFDLPDQNGNLLSSAELAKGNLLICFFRGRWCPFCVAQLEAMNRAFPQIQASGGTLVGISPQTVKQSFFMHDQYHLRFSLLSDSGNQVARQFGLVYRVPAEQQAIYSRTFTNLPFINGDSSWELPIPATYLVGKGGAIKFAAANPDYTLRPEPADLLTLLSEEKGQEKAEV